MIVSLIGTTKEETSLFEGMLASHACDGGYDFLHCREASKLRTTVRACREWSPFGDFASSGALILLI